MIKIFNVSKNYGAMWALRELSLTIEKGDMFGLIGPNGAGKTTLIKILATLLKPTGGSVTIDGVNLASAGPQIRRTIGYLPDFFGVYEDMRVREYLEFFGAAYGVRNPERRKIIDGVLELTDLTEKREALVGTLSRGMQQRLGLARVLVHDPKFLLLDEPASGLDPRARIEIRELLKELRRMGKTILISSHILADLADLCNKIGLIERGKLLYAGQLKDAMQKVERANLWIVEVDGQTDVAAELLKRLPYVSQVETVDAHLEIALNGGEPHQLAEAIQQGGLKLRTLKKGEVTLEEAFLKLTKGEVS